VVKLVTDYFVPVALNADRLPDNDDGKFFLALKKQWPQGLWVVTPTGTVIGFHYHRPKDGESYADGQKRWLTETREMLRSAVKEAGPIPPIGKTVRLDPLADRGRGIRKDGGVRLAVTVIGLRNDRQEGPPVVDSFSLSSEQWSAFRPPESGLTAGRTWTIPESVARQFAPALSPMTDLIFSPTPADVTTARVTAKVDRAGDKVSVVRLTGQWESTHNRDGDPKYPIRTTATGDGVGVLETRTGKMTALVWVLKGTYRNSPPDKPRATAAVVEWAIGR
jgi:hypothetical protein